MLSEYKHTVHGYTAFASAKRPRRAFTLAELVVSMTVFTILAGSTISAILIATKAIPAPNSLSQRRMSAERAISEMGEELFYAVDITSTSLGVGSIESIVFTVHDRGHGASGPETIRYAWSGTAGDPVTREYNGGAADIVVDAVDNFTLEFIRKAKSLPLAPTVLLVVGDAGNPTAQDTARQTVMENWGFTVQMISDHDSPANFEILGAGVDVQYISESVGAAQLVDTDLNPTRGLLTEDRGLYDEIGISSGAVTESRSRIGILDNSHPITSGFSLGNLNICTSNENLFRTNGALAPGGQALADLASGIGLLVIETGGELYGGGIAKARRVKLPWGGGPSVEFPLESLTTDGLTLMQRAMRWAATPVFISRATITLQLTSDHNGPMQTQTQLLNTPEEP